MEITLEKCELQFVSHYRRKIFGGCEMCGKRTRLFPPEEFEDISPPSIYALIENRRVYFMQLPDGLPLVCFECVEREKEGLK